MPHLFRRGDDPAGDVRSDVVLLLVSPPNDQGEYSFGLVNDYVRSAIERARVVIAEVSAQVPRTPCDRPLHPSEVTLVVHTDRAPLELPTASFGQLEQRIAAQWHLISRIERHCRWELAAFRKLFCPVSSIARTLAFIRE